MNTIARIGLISTTLLATHLRADVVKSEYVNESDLEYEVRHMPDLDQNRAGLGNDGQCHCVPTATMNALIYICNHGFPQVAPGPGFWDMPGLYNLATAWIDTLSAPPFMDTSFGEPPEDNGCGTSADGGYAGVKAWLDPHGIFIVGDQSSGFEFTPTFDFIAKSMIAGNVGTLTYGKYEVQGSIKGVPTVRRVGGHVVTPVLFDADFATRTLWVRDPDDDNPVELDSQTPFLTNRMFTVTSLEVIVVDADMNPITGVKSMDVLTVDGSTFRMIDGHRWIRLKEGYTFTSNGHSILVLPPGGMNPLVVPSPSGTEILSMAPIPGGSEYLLVAAASKAGGSNTVHHINTLNGVSVPITFVADPNQVITGPSVCYITADQDTFCFQKDADAISASATTPFPIDAAAYDDAASELVMLSTAAFKLMRYDELLAGAPTILDIPTAVPMGANPRLAINPQDGKVWVSSDGSSTLTGLSENAGGGPMDAEFLTHPLIVAPEGIDFDDRGNLYVATGGGIVEFEPSVGGGWQPVAIPLFGTAAAQGMLHIARSRTNATAVHNGPDWANIPHGERVIIGTEMLDCYADLDGDRLVGITDLLQLLAAWGPCGALCIADIDANGDVGITDLLTLLAAWGPCP